MLFTGKPASLSELENEDWAPSINLGHNSVKKMDRKRKERYDLIKEKRRRTASVEALLQLQYVKPEVSSDHASTSTENVKTTQTDMNMKDIKSLEAEVNHLREANLKLKQDIKVVSLNEDGFRDEDEKVLFYTGLPSWNLLNCIFNFVLPYLSQSTNCTLSPFKRLLMTLIRMRLNLSGKDLAYTFGGIHEATISRTFLQVIDTLYQRLSPLIYWPDRDSLLKTLPMDFCKH